MPKDSKKAGCFNIRIKVNQNAKISPLPHCENLAMGEITFVLEIGEESNCPVPIQVQISTCEADVVFIDT